MTVSAERLLIFRPALYIRTRALEILELLALRTLRRIALFEKDAKLILKVFGIYLREDARADRRPFSAVSHPQRNSALAPRCAQSTVLFDRLPAHTIEESNVWMLTKIGLVRRIDLLRQYRFVAPLGAFLGLNFLE